MCETNALVKLLKKIWHILWSYSLIVSILHSGGSLLRHLVSAEGLAISQEVLQGTSKTIVDSGNPPLRSVAGTLKKNPTKSRRLIRPFLFAFSQICLSSFFDLIWLVEILLFSAAEISKRAKKSKHDFFFYLAIEALM